jgi:hypothetical protein
MRSPNTALLLFVIGIPVPYARSTGTKGLNLKRIVAAVAVGIEPFAERVTHGAGPHHRDQSAAIRQGSLVAIEQ